jgi:CHAT domain-containing protein/Tfp pilus assembly protein PilF
MHPARLRFLAFVLVIGTGWGTAGFPAVQKPPAQSVRPPQSKAVLGGKDRVAAPEEKSFDLFKERRVPHRMSAKVAHVFRVDLRAGQLLRVAVLQKGLDVQLRLLDPGQEVLLTVDSPNGIDGPEPVLIVAEKTGTYHLAVSTKSEPGQGASFVVREVERRVATQRDWKAALALRSYYRARGLLQVSHPNLNAAAEAFLSSTQALRQVGNRELEAFAWSELGGIYALQGQWHRLIVADQSAAALFQRLGKKHEEAVALNQRAEGEQNTGNIDLARSLYERSRSIAREAHDGATEASALTNLGQIQAERAEAWEGSHSLQDALDIYRRIKNKEGEARALGALGLLYTQTGQIEEALTSYQNALHLQGVSLGLQAILLTQMGNSYIYADRADHAFHCFRQALDLQRAGSDPANEASTLVGFGLAYMRSKNYRDALNPYQRALKIYQDRNDLRGRSITLTNIGWALSELMRYDEARDSFSQALELTRQLKNPNLEAAVRLGFAWMERRRENLSEAQRQAEGALKLVETLRNETEDPKVRVAFFSGKQDIYELLISVLMRQYELQGSQDLIAKALWISESARARNLLDNLEGQGEGIATSVLSSQEIQTRVLDHDTVLLEYFLGRSKSYLWLMTQESLEAFELPGKRELETLAMDTYARLAKSHLPEEKAGAIAKTWELSRMILGPVAGRLGSRRLLIVTSGALQYIPFAALPDPNLPLSQALQGGMWPAPLALRHEIIYEPSASVSAEIRRRWADRKPASKLLAVLADGVFEIDDPRLSGMHLSRDGGSSDPVLGHLRRLPASRQEADAIAADLPPDKVKKALGFSASRDLVTSGELGEYGTIHFATHTFFRSQLSGLAAIVLSRYDGRGRKRDGLLRIQDINSLSFKSDLVVLSSCRSGLGEDVPGEGLVGFPQAFLSAGSSGVVISLWNVEDSSTAELMKRFYKNMFARQMSLSSALQQAQIAMWNDSRYRAPWFWAGFIAQGEWKRAPVSLNKNPPGVSSRHGDPRSPSMTTSSSLSLPPR